MNSMGGTMKNLEIPIWLERLPLAPEFRPTDTEFADPIAYISKIEKEASAFGICKVIPPLPKPSRKHVLHNVNKSLSRCPELDVDINLVSLSKTDGGVRNNCDRTVGECRAVFTTRQQELGCEKGKKVKEAVGDQVFGAQKQVWKSGKVYTLEQFEAKAKNFAKSTLGIVKDIDPLLIETMFWKAASEKPIYVEYANDVPGSGFSEPEGLLRYFDRRKKRRRKKRNSFDRNNIGSSDKNNDQVESVNNVRDNKDPGSQNNFSSCTDSALHSLPSKCMHDGASFSGRKDLQDSSNEMEGTAGWKLSNSPWNLQVMARSAGSLTRFMPDDIPGVTSPMVYIGMLFSWFAWHVEDHELHSLNFLHMGSPKTWYSVPGEYAFNFEEAIRLHAYGGNPDRLVALSLLGEKTTVLSPEVIVASGIPCCRLVQHPGEFVVTFPRAYHIGFSHGFNCGEAANFGTSKWLTIAKEAAVRRAAMNYLPMLSHQQLLYLLTMSFISRIPRSLLPGVRSSRLRDRQKEERELSVKRAFIEDILCENNRLTVLLQKHSCYHAVLWDVDLLPSASKESVPYQDADVSVLISAGENSLEKDNHVHDVNDLRKYISAIGHDLDDDDLAYDFQIESGTLPCVACGILGFPLMAVVQPSEVASINFLHMDALAVSVGSALTSNKLEDAKDEFESSKKDLHHSDEPSLPAEQSQSALSLVEQPPLPDGSPTSNHAVVSPKVKTAMRWDISNAFLKPRVFCLEHAIEIEELLSSRGGANVIVICHSDFQKIKAHAAAIAEEIAVPFSYSEILLGNSSPEDLNLIDIAIAREEQVACSKDWTSLYNINLQHCVRMKKSCSPSAKFQHLPSLSGLFRDATPISDKSSTKWMSRKLRSRRHQKRLLQSKPTDDNLTAEKDINRKKEHQMFKKDIKLIQYSRKRHKVCASAGTHALGGTNNLVVRGISDSRVPRVKDDFIAGITLGIEIDGNRFFGQTMLPVDGMSESQCEHLIASSSRGIVVNSFESRCSANFSIASTLIANVEAQTETVGSSTDKNGMTHVAEVGILREEDIFDEAAVAGETCERLAENDFAMPDNVQSDGSCEIKEATRHDDSSNSSEDDGPSPRCDEKMEAVSEQLHVDSEVSKTSSSEGQQLVQTGGDDESTSVLSGGEMNMTGVSPKNDILDDSKTTVQSKSYPKCGSKRKRELLGLQLEGHLHASGFSRSPCEGLRSRARDDSSACITDKREPSVRVAPTVKKSGKATNHSIPHKSKKEYPKGRYKCELDYCTMSFQTKSELLLHKRNQCPVDGCRKKFNSHKYAIQHQRVHDDVRPLKCPWDGCTMSFKWAWARTEHLRVHTGERPYVCKIKGCGLTFRFVSDFSRHRRKTGHYVSPPA